jgi:hypothetical protein
MNQKIIYLSIVLIFNSLICNSNNQKEISSQQDDWLINGSKYTSQIIPSANGKDLVLSNGIVERTFRISPNFACTGIKNLVSGMNYLRAVRPEANITLNGQKYNIGGLSGQPVQNYLTVQWIDNLTNDRNTFQFSKYSISEIKPRFDWKIRKEWISSEVKWPAAGKELVIEFIAPDGAPAALFKGLLVKVHYEIYDGLPLIGKWITVQNNTGKPVIINRFTSEILAAVEGESSVEGESDWVLPNMHVETDYSFSSMSNRKANSAAVHWVTDSTYTSQVNYALKTPCLLEVRPPYGPEWEIKPGQLFESFRAWELFYDSFDKERKGLSARKMYRTIAPWVAENPVLMHVRSADPDAVKLAIDQCAEVGFEMVIMTFGSGFTMESGDAAYYSEIKKLADYAHSKGIALGGYSLLASRSVGAKDDIINPATGKPGGFAYYGNSPCLGSEWGTSYFRKIKEMYEATGLDVIEHDGSYPGDICASTVHPGHKGLDDSQWSQFRTISTFYQWCRSEGVYLNVPDWYFLNGSSKCAMGYREVNWSLLRAQQEIIERQNIFDGTWTKTPSMGWMFVPLTEYQGGGDAATIEPLNQHLDHYGQRFANLFGGGVQACYRGPRLYDTDDTKNLVKKWAGFYKKHRQILDSDIIHLRRADGRDWDGLLHVNPMGVEKGLLMLYNPLEEPITRELKIPVYYTGLSQTVHVAEQEGSFVAYPINRDYEIVLKVTIPAKGYQYFLLK